MRAVSSFSNPTDLNFRIAFTDQCQDFNGAANSRGGVNENNMPIVDGAAQGRLCTGPPTNYYTGLANVGYPTLRADGLTRYRFILRRIQTIDGAVGPNWPGNIPLDWKAVLSIPGNGDRDLAIRTFPVVINGVVDHSQIDLVVDMSAADATQRIMTISAIPFAAPGNNNINPYASNTTNNLAINGGSVTTRLTISNESILSTASANPSNTLTRLEWTFGPIVQGSAITITSDPNILSNLGCTRGTTINPGNFKYTWYLLDNSQSTPTFESWSENTRPKPIAGPNTYPTLEYATLGGGNLLGKVLYCVVERNKDNLCGVANSTSNAMYAFIKTATFDANGDGGGQSGSGESRNNGSPLGSTQFIAYPNPSNEKIVFRYNSILGLIANGRIDAIVLDASGRKVLDLPHFVDNTQIVIKKLSQGLYRVVRKDSKKTLATFIKN